ncbi:AMP nucleosidase [Paracoccus sp. S-4012]|uniref:AMP nucleosidase n=1 Tax=Paracoccus sp. S-4012 TaxID=2665648 RepID=UPI0012AF2FB4|nr:AMP nucleosidase [Paracoccus sp. S-4012]MRX50946.1 AMP nucleosidase [Paracoccus sp. S-4012]
MDKPARLLPVETPEPVERQQFTDPEAAVERLIWLYDRAATFLLEKFLGTLNGIPPDARFRAFYPEVRLTTTSHSKTDSRLAFGHVALPGRYAASVTRPRLFRDYLVAQIGLLIRNHDVPVTVGESATPMPVHFAVATQSDLNVPQEGVLNFSLRDVFDVPDLASVNDDIVNDTLDAHPEGDRPLATFTAQRVDYSLARLAHYTATQPEHFQNFVLFTNYQFYVDEFEALARRMLADPASGYTGFVGPGNQHFGTDEEIIATGARLPQMPAYHLIRPNHQGITLVNIGVGPSNAKTATDHIAVLRPHVWLMVGHCAGLRNSQSLGDYVLAHAYLRQDHVLDDDLPIWVPLPTLAEVQVAVQEAVAEVTQLDGYELKRIMRTGTVVTIDNRNWELRDTPIHRLSLSRAVALDMESATIAANGFRFRVPYGTLLCVSDKPLHGELKLPGMATDFYRSQVANHLLIGVRAMEKLRELPLEELHSRKLRSFNETAFL